MHKFCSLCIRQSVRADPRCPVCCRPTAASDIVADQWAQEVCAAFRRHKDEMEYRAEEEEEEEEKERQETQGTEKGDNGGAGAQMTEGVERLDGAGKGPSSEAAHDTEDDAEDDENDSDFVVVVESSHDTDVEQRQERRQTPRRRQSQQQRHQQTQTQVRALATPAATQTGSTQRRSQECPICRGTIFGDDLRFQIHVNECIDRQQKKEAKTVAALHRGTGGDKGKSASAAADKRNVDSAGAASAGAARVTKLPYDTMTFKQMVEACRRYGVPVDKGADKKEDLVWRYAQLEIRSKTNADGGGEKSLPELVREVLKAERVRKRTGADVGAVAAMTGKRKDHPSAEDGVAGGIGVALAAAAAATAAKTTAAAAAAARRGIGGAGVPCDRLSREEWLELIRVAEENNVKTLERPQGGARRCSRGGGGEGTILAREDGDVDKDVDKDADTNGNTLVDDSGNDDGSDDDVVVASDTSERKKARVSNFSEQELQEIISGGLLDECCVANEAGFS